MSSLHPFDTAAALLAQATGPARVEWAKRYDMRFIEGEIPAEWNGEDQGAGRTHLLLRDDPPRLLDFASLTAMLQATGSGYLMGQTQAQAFRNGYFDQTAQLWSEARDLLVTTHQVVYYKE